MRNCRAILALLLVLALVLGTGWPMPAAAEMQRGTQAAKMVVYAMAPDLLMSDMCDKCTKSEPATHACFAVCVGVQAALPVVAILRVATKAPLDLRVELQLDGSAAPPDLPPPKLRLFA